MSIASIIMRNCILSTVFFICNAVAAAPWGFRLTTETPQLTNRPFFLHIAADINGNDLEELVVTDFGRYGNKLWEEQLGEPDNFYNLYILEWDRKQLRQKLHKRWDISGFDANRRLEYFQGYGAFRILTWPISGSIYVETMPPYLGIQWKKKDYVLHEQQGKGFQKSSLIGSWALPWVSPYCYPDFAVDKDRPPRECIIGIRDFSGKGDPKIVSIYEEGVVKTYRTGRKHKEYGKQALRVRRFKENFDKEWELKLFDKHLSKYGQIDQFNLRSDLPLLIGVSSKTEWLWVNLELDKSKNNYKLEYLKTKRSRGIESYDLRDVYLRTTKKKGLWEYWGYHRVKTPKHPYLSFIRMLRNVRLNSDKSNFIREDVKFPHHKPFLGVGYFIVEDIDGDGLSEVILVEETGKAKPGHDSPIYYEVKDYIRILKWNGKEYKTKWVSPPYTKRGTKFLAADIKGTGKKQLVVLSPYGTVQVWERQ